MFDPAKEFRAVAQRLNAMKPDSKARCFFECMSWGLTWTDERPAFRVSTDELGALRVIWNYRTSLILGKPRMEFNEIWSTGLALAPQWPGFLPERRHPRPDLLALIPETKRR